MKRAGLTLAGLLAALVSSTALVRADALLSGTITSAAGDKMGGVTVSAKADGATITTTVYTDQNGATANAKIELAANKAQDFRLDPLKDFVRQLPGDLMLEALPETTEHDKKMKRLVRNNCTGCHTPSYVLQHKFDETGWSTIIDLMKHVNVSGIYQGENSKPNGILQFNQKDLAKYLADARGPGPTSMKFEPAPRPNGEAARVVFREYDVPPDADNAPVRSNDGHDWSLGTPSKTGRRGLGVVDPKTEKIAVHIPPAGMAPTGGAVTVDVDPQGNVWASSPTGALRFDPKTEKFTEFKSVTPKTANGNGVTYGAAVDRDGNGWWAEMQIDIIGRGDVATGQASEIRLAPVESELKRASAEEKKYYDGFAAHDFNAPFPWSQGPRRMGTDKNADTLWIGNSWGGSLAKINTKTQEVSYVPLPGAMQPYHIAVDSKHNAWLNVWTADSILRLDPSTNTWTRFDLPTRGTEARYISVTEHTGALQVIVPLYRTSKIAVMSFRSEADLAALKAQAGR